MKKKLLVFVIVLLAVGSAAYIVFAAHRPTQPASAKQPVMPPGYGALKVGMSQDQVVSQVGPPVQKSRYSRYEQRPPQYWDALQKQVGDASSQPAYGGAPSLSSIRAATELTHRYRDIWQYKPLPGMLMTLYFDDGGTLLNIGTAAGGGKGRSPAKPGQGTTSPKA